MRLYFLKIINILFLLVMLIPILSVKYYAYDIQPSGTLPVIYINTENVDEVEHRSFYINAEMKIILDDETSEFTNIYTENYNPIEIRGRGNSTWGMPKKPYHIKLSEKTKLFGMSKNKHWILLANAFDGSHLRNALSFDLSDELGLYSIRHMHVELVLNGRYVGLYQLTESIKIAPDRIDITDWEQLAEKTAESIAKTEKMSREDTDRLIMDMNSDLSWITLGIFKNYRIADYNDITSYDTTGGYLIELDEYYDEETKFITEHDVPIMLKQPEYLKTNREMFDYIQTYIHDMEDALFSEDGYNGYEKHYTEYLDMDSFIDYWIVNQAFKSVELLYKSAFMYKDANGPIIFGPIWDMDWSSGNHVNLWASSATYDEWNHSESQDREYWYRAIYDDPYFIARLQDRWLQVRGTIKDCIDSIDSWTQKLETPANLNIEAWGDMGGWNFEKECSFLKTWMNNRWNWMDKQLSLRDPDIMGMGIMQNKNIELSLIGSDGFELGNRDDNNLKNSDFYYNGSGRIQGNVVIKDKNIRNLDIYINGSKTASVGITGGRSSFEINTADLYKADSGNRNVVLAIARGSGNKILGKNYKTFTVSGTQMKTVVYASDIKNTDLIPKTTECAEGATFNIPFLIPAAEGHAFKCWTYNANNYYPGDKYTVQPGSSDILFMAVWENDQQNNVEISAAVFIPGFSVIALGVVLFYLFYSRLPKK